MGTEFRILGPTEVVRDGQPVALGGRKQRALLTYLVLHAGEVVAADRLADALWPEAAFESASRSLQVYMSALRKALGDAGGLVQSRQGGYVLTAAADQVDVSRFEALARDGVAALEAGNPGQTHVLLSEALGLWRGPALADVSDQPYAESAVARLEEARLATVENQMEARLALARHQDVVPELTDLVAKHPFRERLLAQLMLALYRSGRQADALAAYRAGSARMAKDLGVEPGPALRSLQIAILRHDPTLDVDDPQMRDRRRLPTPPTALVGRQAEVAEIRGLYVDEVARLVTLTGPGGIGKTRLALRAAELLADRFRDGIHFVDLAPIRRESLVAATIAGALNIPEPTHGEWLDALIDGLRTRELLLLLDNMEQVDDAAMLLSKLLAAAPRLSFLVTSRRPLDLYGEYVYPVPPLAVPEPRAPEPADYGAVALFRARARAVRSNFEVSPGNAAAIVEICRRLDGLPLAIELAAARVGTVTPTEIVAAFARSLDLLGTGARDLPARQRTMHAAIEWSVELLETEQQELFAALGVFSGGWTSEAAAAVCGADDTLLADLVRANLVHEIARPSGTRLRMLETVREYASELLAASGRESDVRRRHAEHYLEFATAIEDPRRDSPDQAAVLDQLEAEHDNFRAAFAWAQTAQQPELSLRLADQLHYFWRVRGHLAEGRQWLEEALRLPGAVPPAVRAAALNTAATLAFRQKDFGRSRMHWEQALAIYRSIGDAGGIARMTTELGGVAVGEQDYRRAEEMYEEGLRECRRLGEHRMAAITVCNLGWVAVLAGNLERGRHLAEQALPDLRRLAEPDSVALDLYNLGRISLAQGRLDEAASALAECLQTAQKLQYRELSALTLQAFADLAAAAEQWRVAAQLLGAAERLLSQLGVPLDPHEQGVRERTVRALQAELAPHELNAAKEHGADLDEDRAIAMALSVAVAAEAPPVPVEDSAR